MAYTPSAHEAEVVRLRLENRFVLQEPKLKGLLIKNTLFFHLLRTKWIHSLYVLHTEWHAEEEKRAWWYFCLKPTTPLIGRLRSSCLVTTFYDAIHTCCDEKFKLTTELFCGTSTWDIDVLWDIWIRAGSRTSNKRTQRRKTYAHSGNTGLTPSSRFRLLYFQMHRWPQSGLYNAKNV